MIESLAIAKEQGRVFQQGRGHNICAMLRQVPRDATSQRMTHDYGRVSDSLADDRGNILRISVERGTARRPLLLSVTPQINTQDPAAPHDFAGQPSM